MPAWFPPGGDWGTGPITLVLTIAIVALVGYYQMKATREDVREVPSSTPAAERRLSGAAPKA